jgi:hypothetical protein
MISRFVYSGQEIYFVCVPDVTGTIPVSVVKKGLGTPIYGECYIFVWGIVGECLWVMPLGYQKKSYNETHLNQLSLVVNSRLSHRAHSSRHHCLVNRYGISVSYIGAVCC